MAQDEWDENKMCYSIFYINVASFSTVLRIEVPHVVGLVQVYFPFLCIINSSAIFRIFFKIYITQEVTQNCRNNAQKQKEALKYTEIMSHTAEKQVWQFSRKYIDEKELLCRIMGRSWIFCRWNVHSFILKIFKMGNSWDICLTSRVIQDKLMQSSSSSSFKWTLRLVITLLLERVIQQNI